MLRELLAIWTTKLLEIFIRLKWVLELYLKIWIMLTNLLLHLQTMGILVILLGAFNQVSEYILVHNGMCIRDEDASVIPCELVFR